jgi:Ca-activated chloride channel family protein
MTDQVNLALRWGRSPAAAGAAAQVGYLLIEVSAPPSVATPASLNFCMLLDRSGSMKGAKLQAMKDAAARVVDSLSADDIVSLVTFNDDAPELLIPATPAADKTALKAAIAAIEEAGGTAMSKGMRAAQAELAKHPAGDRVAQLLLLTDGQTWGDEDECRQVGQELGAAGVRVTALGLGAEWNAQLLDDLASATQGSSDYIAEPAQIDSFFQRAVRTAQGTIAREVRLLLRLVRDAAPRAVYRVLPAISNLGYTPIGANEVAVNLGDLSSTTLASLIVDLQLPPRAPGSYRVAQAELHYMSLGGSHQQLKRDIVLDFSADAAAPQFDPQVMNLVEKVTAFKLQTRALSEADAGNTAGATQKLRAAATRLLDLGELELATTMREQAETLERGEALSAESQKELRYATRRLTQKLEE